MEKDLPKTKIEKIEYIGTAVPSIQRYKKGSISRTKHWQCTVSYKHTYLIEDLAFIYHVT